MRFIIRHRISPLEEEVYEFSITNASIKYVGFWRSKRKSKKEPFGYDWDDLYKDQKFEELDALDEVYGSSDDIGEYDYNHPKYEARRTILKKYNPIEQGVLGGCYSSTIAKDYPLKVSEDLILKEAIKHLKTLKIL